MLQPFAILDNRKSLSKSMCFRSPLRFRVPLRFRSWSGKTVIVMLVACLLASANGCSKEKLAEMANTVNDKVKEQAKNITESAVVAEVIPATGRAEIKVTPPVESKAAYARLYVIGDGRPGVVQFTSYDPDKGPNTYPALQPTSSAVLACGANSKHIKSCRRHLATRWFQRLRYSARPLTK